MACIEPTDHNGEPAPVQPRVRLALVGGGEDIDEALAYMALTNGWIVEPVSLRTLQDIHEDTWNVVIFWIDGINSEAIAACARLSANRRRRVMVISRDRDPQHIADVLQAGADDYLVEPFWSAECAARVRSLVERAEAHAATAGSRPKLMPPCSGAATGPP